ncbi:MAG: OmpA family protein [bacterium]
MQKVLLVIFLLFIALSETIPQSQTGKVEWSKYDFVPGDIIIFEDDLIGEQNGEFPSKWDLTKGTIENAMLDGENVIYFIECNTNGGGGIVPLLKNSKEDYLPEEFTIEFDAYFERPNNHYLLYLVDYKNQLKLDKEFKAGDKWLRFEQNSIDGKNITANWYPGTSGKDTKPNPGWRHIAVSFNKRALKAYLDDSRIINIPNLDYNPTGITLGYHNPGGNKKGYVKNIRIAKGAVPLYDKMMSDGKIVTTGIKFDVNKSNIKPESMGVINSIINLMNEKPDLNFSVEGHTDSDGDEKSNQTLSEVRAKSVMNKLIELGVNSSRLNSKGFGESKPIADNNTTEGKANNRRVEFVKF